MLREGDKWSLEFDDGVVVGVFEKGMQLDAFGDEVYPAFEEILAEHGDDVVGTVDLVRLDKPFGDDVLEIWERAARKSAQLPNYRRTALVADGIKNFSLRNQLKVSGAEIKTFDDHRQAIQWARKTG